MISKLSRFFQMIANFLDDFKTVRIFPDADGNSQFLFRGEGVPKIPLKKLRKKQVFLVPKPLFRCASISWTHVGESAVTESLMFLRFCQILSNVTRSASERAQLFEVLTMILTPVVEHLQSSFSLSCHITIPPH